MSSTPPDMLLDLRGFERALDGSPWDRMTDPVVIGSVVAAIGVSVMIAWYRAARRSDRAAAGPAFRTIAAAAGLDGSQRRLTMALARAGSVATPASMLLSSGYFDHIVRTIGGTHDLNPAQISQLRARLFGPE